MNSRQTNINAAKLLGIDTFKQCTSCKRVNSTCEGWGNLCCDCDGIAEDNTNVDIFEQTDRGANYREKCIIALAIKYSIQIVRLSDGQAYYFFLNATGDTTEAYSSDKEALAAAINAAQS